MKRLRNQILPRIVNGTYILQSRKKNDLSYNLLSKLVVVLAFSLFIVSLSLLVLGSLEKQSVKKLDLKKI